MKKFILKYKKHLAVIGLIAGMLAGGIAPLPQCYSQNKKPVIRDTTKGPTVLQNSEEKKKCGPLPIDRAALQKAKDYESSNARSSTPENRLLKVYFHVFRDNDGNNPGATEEDIENEFEQLKSDYSSYNICFIKMGIDYINNSLLNNALPVELPNSANFLYPYCFDDCIDIFYHNNLPNWGGWAYSIPSTVCSINKSNIGGQTISHEVGHCLGLLHTFESAFGLECIDGSNSASKGDWITDTNADPDPGNPLFSQASCLYNGFCLDPCGQINYNPPYNNIMSYWQSATCYTSQQFTEGQFYRINNFLNSDINLQNCESLSDLTVGPVDYSSGYHMRSAINTLTTNGSVNITGSSITTLGSNLVLLKPGFVANPSSGGLTLIIASTCGYSAARNATATATEVTESAKKISGTPSKTITSENQVSLKCYPNPFSSIVNLSYTPNSTGKLRIDVVDIQGKIIKSAAGQVSEKGVTMKMELNLGNIPSGVYFLKVSDGITSSVQKIVKM